MEFRSIWTKKKCTHGSRVYVTWTDPDLFPAKYWQLKRTAQHYLKMFASATKLQANKNIVVASDSLLVFISLNSEEISILKYHKESGNVSYIQWSATLTNNYIIVI